MAQRYADEVAARIKQRREELKAEDPRWTQGYVADRVNDITGRKYQGADVSRWETGLHKPADESLDALGRILEVDLSAFYAAPAGDGDGTPPLLDRFARPDPAQLDRVERMLTALVAHLLGEAELDVILTTRRLSHSASSSGETDPGPQTPPANGD